MNNNAKYVLYIILFIVFLLVRINHIVNTQGIYEIDFKGLAIASSSFPFGIIKNTAIYDFFSPLYYLLIHFFVIFTIFKYNSSVICHSLKSRIKIVSNRKTGLYTFKTLTRA